MQEVTQADKEAHAGTQAGRKAQILRRLVLAACLAHTYAPAAGTGWGLSPLLLRVHGVVLP